jgi:hypothetical protein
MVNLSDEAMEYIANKIELAESAGPPTRDAIPLLVWVSKAQFIANSGDRTDYGPYFAFHWTTERDIEQFHYATVPIADRKIVALAPGDLFRTGSISIKRNGDCVTLVPGD